MMIPQNDSSSESTLYLGLHPGKGFGWGVCSNYLIKEFNARCKIEVIQEFNDQRKLSGTMFHGLSNFELESMFNARGEKNYGYTFFEQKLNANSIENGKKWDGVFAGSSFCRTILEANGIRNTHLLIQGVDTNNFYPITKERIEPGFVIFSGGKLELRKSQDIVIKAVAEIQKQYKDVLLVCLWHNPWPQFADTITLSKWVHGSLNHTIPPVDMVKSFCAINGLDVDKVIVIPQMPMENLRELYSKTDIGLFPNRCEGGTNLVLMEYMACSKPVIASYATGHTDILTEKNSILLKDNKPFDNPAALHLAPMEWVEPSLDEVIEKLEFAYNNRDHIRQLGNQAGMDLQNMTWGATADKALKILQSN